MRGRVLSEADVNGARRVAVVNQTLVTKYFGQENPLGQQIRFKLLETMPQGRVENPVFEIVGVVSDVKNQGIQEPTVPEAFIPYTVTGAFERGILVRTQGDPAALIERVRREVWAVDRGVAITLTGTLNGYLAQFSYAEPRFSLVLLGVFASRRAGAGCDRRLQRDRVHGVAADPRNRHPHGARRRACPRVADGRADGPAPRRARRRDWTRWPASARPA